MRPRTASLASIPIPHEHRWLIFPPESRYHYPPPPSPSPPPPSPPRPFIVPHRRSRHPSQSSAEFNIVPHSLIPGVYVSNDGSNGNITLYTKNLVPGIRTLDGYDDIVISLKDEDGTTVEYREWSPLESKLAAAILSGAKNIWIQPGSRVLVLFSRDDEQFGITISHISDIVGSQGMVYVLEGSNCKTLLAMADKRLNILPIIHINMPYQYRMLINMVDVLFASLDSAEQADMAEMNARYFLKADGHYMLYVQTNCIESTNRGDAVFSCSSKGKQVQFKRMEHVTLEPFDRDHAYVGGVFRTLEIADIDPRCLVTSKFWTSQDTYRGNERRLTLYEKQKNLPVFMLFESSCGYVLFRAHDVYKVERNYVAIEEYINRFNEFFEFIACHTFESTNDALMYLNAACNDSLPAGLKEFLVLHLPTAMKGGEHCYSLALPTISMGDELVTATNIACSASHFHEEIIRGVRKNIDKFFKNMKPGELENAQLDLARNYCRQKLISPEKGKSQKKRDAFQASVLTIKKPKEKEADRC